MTAGTPTARSHAGAAPWSRIVGAHALLELRLLLRSPESLLVTLAVPIGVLVVAGGTGLVPTDAADPVAFLVPGVLTIAVMATALVALAIQTGFERRYGVLKRLGGTPLSRGGFLASKALAVGVLVAVQTAAVLGLAAGALGWRPDGGALAVAAVLVVGTYTFSAIGLALAGTLRAEATLAVVNALFLVLLVVGGVVIDLDRFPSAVARVGAWTPAGSLADALRAAFAGTGVVGDLAGGLARLGGWGAAATAAAVRTFRWDP